MENFLNEMELKFVINETPAEAKAIMGCLHDDKLVQRHLNRMFKTEEEVLQFFRDHTEDKTFKEAIKEVHDHL